MAERDAAAARGLREAREPLHNLVAVHVRVFAGGDIEAEQPKVRRAERAGHVEPAAEGVERRAERLADACLAEGRAERPHAQPVFLKAHAQGGSFLL